MFNRLADQTLRGTRPHPCNDTGAHIRHARGSHVHSGACTSSPSGSRDTRSHARRMEKSFRSSNERGINNSTPSNRRSSVLKQASKPPGSHEASEIVSEKGLKTNTNKLCISCSFGSFGGLLTVVGTNDRSLNVQKERPERIP